MRSLSPILALMTLLCLLPMAGNAASFDCAKASSDVEKLICGSDELGVIDESLAQAYKEARQRDPEQAQAIRTEQRAWLRFVRDLCYDEECLIRVQTQRIEGLAAARDQGIPSRVLGLFGKREPSCFVADNEEGMLCEGEIDSSILVLPEGPDVVGVSALLFFFNGHTCSFSGRGHWVDGRIKARHEEDQGDQFCELSLNYNATGLVTDASTGCQDYCGMRGTLHGIELQRR